MRKRGGYQVEAHINRTANVLDGGTIRHQEHTLLVQRAEGILDRLAIGARTIGGVDRHDIGTGSNAGASVTQRRRDVNALVPILPQADNRNLTATLNGGNVGKALAANGGGAAKLASARHLSHGLGRTKRLAHIRLNAHDELALQGLNQRINGHVRLNLSQNSLLRHRTLTFKPSLAYRSTLRSSFTSICGTSEGALGSYVYFNDARRCSAAPMSGASPSREPMRIGVS